MEPRRRAQPQGCGGQSGEIPAQRLSTGQHSPPQEACLLSCRGRRGLGAEARASVLAGRVSGKKSAAAEEARDFFLPLFSQRARRGDSERRLNELQRRARAAAISVDPRGGCEPWLTTWTPETGTSHGYQRGPQRWGGDAKPAAAAATKKPVCEHRSLSTPPLPGACAARHHQAPVIQGQLPWENTWHASGCWKVTPASAATGSPWRLAPHPYPSLPPT